ncbi:MAG: choline transporter-like protein [Benniella sp.]|nr:MAG: choline transporter-like protein [Benniella sp.]
MLTRKIVQRVVWITVLSVPCFALVIFIWCLVSSFQGPRPDGRRTPQDTGLTVLSFLPLSIGSLFMTLLYVRRQNVARTTEIIELACEILKDNPDMFFVSFGLMLIHVVFTATWLLFFSRVFLIGHNESTTLARKWVQDENFYPIAGFMIFMYMWTSAVLSNVQRVTLANVVSKWYFHRHEPFAYHSSKITEPALINATTTMFGSVCLGALFIAITQFITFLMDRTVKRLKDSQHSTVLTILAACCRFIQGLVENFNNYTLIYAGITGESLFSAARSASKLFNQNVLWGLMSDILTKVILYIYSTLLALFTGFAAYIYATHSLKSPYGYVIGILATIIPFYIARFFTHVMSITVDATFLCYAIDRDTNMCHCNKAHSAFGPQ